MQLEGQIRDIDIVERLVELWREKFTGAFRFEQDGVIKILYFKSGDVLSASTNDRTDAIDEILLRAGKVSREHVKQALAKRKESETLGDALLNLGFITRKELTWARRVQVIGILRSISGWQEGSYTGVADYLPKREEGTLFPLPQVILELIVTDNDRAKFEQAMDGGGAVFAKTPDFDETYRRLGLNDDADAIVNEIDGEKSAADVAAASGKDAFNAYKLIEALRALGVVTRIERTHGAPELSFDDFESAGVSDASSVWDEEAPELDLAPTVETPAPHDVPLVVPAAEPEPEWGFDEAQIETARRAAVPVSSAATEPSPPPMRDVVKKASKPDRWLWIIMFAIVLVGLGIAAPYAWNWWEARNAPPAPVVVKRKPRLKPVPSVAPAILPATATTTTTTTTTTPAGEIAGATQNPVTTSAAPPAAPVVKITPQKTTANTTRIERNAAGAVTMTNSGAALPKVSVKEDAIRSHYDEMAQTFASQATGKYTVQFELVCQTSSVTKAIQAGGVNVWFIPISYKGQGCYRVFWGHYTTKAEAQKGLEEIPAGLRAESKPAVVSVPKK